MFNTKTGLKLLRGCLEGFTCLMLISLSKDKSSNLFKFMTDLDGTLPGNPVHLLHGHPHLPHPPPRHLREFHLYIYLYLSTHSLLYLYILDYTLLPTVENEDGEEKN
jgi:hypothetical protein